MAYPFYPTYPYGYTPQIQPTQPPQQPQQAAGIIWVSGAQEAQMYPVAPNNAVALWEQSGKTIYLKSADATGKPTMRVYDLVERTETASAALGNQDEKVHDYATKEELSAVALAIKNVLGDIEQMKGDLYGVAGRKKTVKKGEDDDS